LEKKASGRTPSLMLFFQLAIAFFFSLLAIYSQNAVKNEFKKKKKKEKRKKYKIASAKIKGFQRFSIAITRIF
jgi:energy-converting hydrogenase Eha subunit H